MRSTWPKVTLAEVLDDAISGFASGDDLPTGVLQCRMNNVGTDGSLNFDKKRRVRSPDGRSEKYLVQPGDVLFNATNSPQLVGKTAYFAGYHEPVVFSNHFLRLRAKEDRLSGQYLARWLQLLFSRGVFQARSRQWVNQATFDKAMLSEVQIPLPPIEEQRRIATILDKADELRAKRRAAIGHLATLVQAIFIEIFGSPKADAGTRLGEIATFVGGGTPSKSNSAYFAGDICWATSKDIKSLLLTDTQDHITEEAIAKSATKRVSPGTVLVVVKSKILGRRLPVCITRVETCFGQDIKGIQSSVVSPEFLSTALLVGQRWLLDKARGVNTEGLTLDHLRSFPVSLGTEHQRARFQERFELSLQLEQKNTVAKALEDDLFASLQSRAFRGLL